MPNTPARLTLKVSANANNTVQFGADNGLLVPDQVSASGAMDGPAAFYAIPNHMSTLNDKWWRSWSIAGFNNNYGAYQHIAQPLFVTKTARLQALAACTTSSASGWANYITVSVFEWTGVGLQFTRLDTAYIPPQSGAAGVQVGYFQIYPTLKVGTPYVLISSSPTTYYCYSKRNLPGIFPQKATLVNPSPTDVNTYPGLASTISNGSPDAANMSPLDLDSTSPGTWTQTLYVPFFCVRLGAA